MDARDLFGREAGGGEPLDAAGVGFPAAERADVEATRTERMDEARIVDLGIVRQGDEGGPGVDIEPGQRGVGPVRDQRHIGKALGRGEGGARIDDRHVESEGARHGRHRLADMNGADHHEPDRRDMHGQEHLAARDLDHLAPALPDRGSDRFALLSAARGAFARSTARTSSASPLSISVRRAAARRAARSALRAASSSSFTGAAPHRR